MKKELSIETIEHWLKDSDCHVCSAAINACRGKDVPIDVIDRWLKDSDWRVRAAAMNAVQSKDVPIDVIKRWLKDSNECFRIAGMYACKRAWIPVPIIRTIEPPDLVYSMCAANVIVVAEIPKDAQIRGTYGEMCRANKAIIKEVIGDTCGEKVGISIHDNAKIYFPGDEIYIEDFDMSNNQYSPGFHFFCTREEAENYYSE